jgi:hypothetical protein
MDMAQDHGEFIEVGEVARQSGMPLATLRRRLRQRGIQLWSNPFDLRQRLVRPEDIAELFAYQPIKTRAA